MRVLVAGGTGFVGSHVVEAFAAEGHSVRSLARRPPALDVRRGVDYRVGDLGNRVDVEASMADVDVAVFAVTTTTPGSASRDSAFDAATNLVNAIHFLESAVAARVPRLVMISSGGTVYGVPRELPIPESHPTEPISGYGVTKLAIEKYFALYTLHSETTATILRAGNAFGERQLPGTGQGASAAFLAALIRGEPVEIWGDGSVVRDYVYAGDLAAACLAAVGRDQEGPCLVCNVGSGAGISIAALLEACAAVAGREAEVVYKAARPFDVPEIVLDVGRAAELLDWTPSTTLATGLEREAAWLERALAPTDAAAGWRA
jgi:UDP-glucose 4-epimerase